MGGEDLKFVVSHVFPPCCAEVMLMVKLHTKKMNIKLDIYKFPMLSGIIYIKLHDIILYVKQTEEN